MNARRGPPQVLRQHPRQDNDETQYYSETLVNNQCSFIRGVYIKDRLNTGKYGPMEEGGCDWCEYVTVESLVQVPPTHWQASPCTIGYLSDGNFRYRAKPSLQFSSITCWR